MPEKDLLVDPASMLATYKLADNKPANLVKMKLAVGQRASSTSVVRLRPARLVDGAVDLLDEDGCTSCHV